MARSRWSSLLLLGSVTMVGAVIAAACFPRPAADDKTCVAGAYVYCRCEDRNEGTKLCNADEQSFQACKCLASQQRPPLIPPGSVNPPTQVITQDGGISLPVSCANKLVVFGSRLKNEDGGEDNVLSVARYLGNDQWSSEPKVGPALRGPVHSGLVGNAAVSVWASRFQLVGWTKFSGAEVPAAESVGFISSAKDPGFFPAGEEARIFHTELDEHATIFQGKYTSAAGWDEGLTDVGGGGETMDDKTGPAAANAGGNATLVFAGGGRLATQNETNGTFGPIATIQGTKVRDSDPPQPLITGLGTGAEDVLVVYEGDDLLLHSVTRKSADGAWNAPRVVDTTASPNGSASLASIGNGRAVLVWRASDSRAAFAIYENGTWGAPGTIGDGVMVAQSPSVGSGRCGSEATASLPATNGTVVLEQLSGGKWIGPFVVPGMKDMIFTGTAELTP